MSYEFDGRVRYSEIDEKGRLSISSLVNYFQDASTFQSEELGVGIEFMKERNMAWILSYWQIVIDRFPKLGEKVIAQTWPYDFNGFYGMRNFVLLDGDRKMVARANSVWVQFDVEKQRPVRCSNEVMEKYALEEPVEMDYAPRKVEIPKEGVKEPSFVIEKHLLDTNHHVNNGQYIALAEGYLPGDFEIRQLRAEYRIQARLYDVMVPIVSRQEDKVTVTLCNEAEKPYAIVEFQR